MTGRGRLIVFEGGEGSGKSTQLRLLAETLAARAIPHLCLREPGGTELGTAVRTILLDRGTDVVPRAEALLFMASRAQLVEKAIRPALERGDVVLVDRFFLSTYGYQVAGQGLSEREVRSANAFATGGLVPDLTFLLTYPVLDGLRRAARRDRAPDRIESLGEGFHQRVAAAFDEFATADWQAAHPECGPIVPLDATGSERDVAMRLGTELQRRWPGTFPPFGASD